MKNKVFTLILLSVTVVTLSSCFTSRSKYGCPSTVQVKKSSHHI